MFEKVKRLWSQGQEVETAATLLMVTILLSNVLGLLRDVILANTNRLGELDTYYVAFKIPDFLFNLFILGAMSTAFIPVFLDVKAKQGDKEAWRLAHNVLHVALGVLLVLGAVLWIFMPALLPHFVPGFDPDKIQRTIPLARILLVSPFFFAISYILGAVLNANKKFFAYALAPLIYNVSIIVGGFLSPYFGIMGVAWSVVIGALLHALIQVPTILSLRYHYSFQFNLKDKNLRQIVRLMIPQSISLGMPQLTMLAFTWIASFLPSGAISIYTLTDHVQTTPTAIFASAIGTAIFPMLGQAKSTHNRQQFKQLLTRGLQGMFYFMIPSMALLWVFRAHIIRLFLALNHQTWTDTIRAIDTFGWFIIGLAAEGFVLIMIRAFYAQQDTRRPMIAAVFTGILAVILAWVLVPHYRDVPVLALAFSLSGIVEAVILVVVFQRRYPGLIDWKEVGQTIGMATVFSIAAALLARLTLSIVSEGALTPTTGLGTTHIVPLFIALLLASLIGVLAYVLLSLIVSREELLWIMPKKAARGVILPVSEEIATPEGLAKP